MASKTLATNNTDPRVMLRVLTAVKRGDFTVRMPVTSTGQAGKVATAINDIIESNQRLERELRRLSKRVGRHAGRDQRPDRRRGPPQHRDGPSHQRGGPG
jgi:methyl-accepting chemotaxis protein